jgi:hypothetical protein
MDDLDRPHVPVFGYSWVPGRRFAYLAEQRLIAVLMVGGINLGWATTNQISDACRMKRRTLKRLRPGQLPEHHHNVYVVLLEPAVGRIRKVRAENPKRNPKKPCIYVGMTGLTPEERFANHKAGTKAAAVVKRYGLRLLPELYGQTWYWQEHLV